MAQMNLMGKDAFGKCPGCGGECVPTLAADFFRLCRDCGNGYNFNYSPPALYYEGVSLKERIKKLQGRKQ